MYSNSQGKRGAEKSRWKSGQIQAHSTRWYGLSAQIIKWSRVYIKYTENTLKKLAALWKERHRITRRYASWLKWVWLTTKNVIISASLYKTNYYTSYRQYIKKKLAFEERLESTLSLTIHELQIMYSTSSQPTIKLCGSCTRGLEKACNLIENCLHFLNATIAIP